MASVLAMGIVTGIITVGFGIWNHLRDRTTVADILLRPGIKTDGLNETHAIPGALYTYPEGDEQTRLYLGALLERFRDRMGPDRSIKSDAELTDTDLKTRTIYIYGTPGNHSLFRRLRRQLPIVFEEDGAIVGSAA